MMTIKTKHLFKILTIIKKTGVLDKIKDFYSQVNNQSKGEKPKEDLKSLQTELGIDIMVAIVGGLDGAENDIYELLADIDGKEVRDIQEQDPNLTIEAIKEIVGSDVFKSFLSTVTK